MAAAIAVVALWAGCGVGRPTGYDHDVIEVCADGVDLDTVTLGDGADVVDVTVDCGRFRAGLGVDFAVVIVTP